MTRHNCSRNGHYQVSVVNCFQKLLSSWHDTTPQRSPRLILQLWIAFKNYYLRDTTQRNIFTSNWNSCCELLSKIIIFVTRHNFDRNSMKTITVVNCFQKLLSSWHDTTPPPNPRGQDWLWIAFKNYYLRDTTQHPRCEECHPSRCELLSKIIIFVTRHNFGFVKTASFLVVNCFQKLLSSWHDTTNPTAFLISMMLWIAFKNYYLRDTTQHTIDKLSAPISCELLSKIIIFVTRHNTFAAEVISVDVVNCFQKLLSSWHDTTMSLLLIKHPQLWIAFKNYYLRDTTQQMKVLLTLDNSCELLSKIIIFVTRHNW